MSFVELREIASIADIGEGVLTSRVPLRDLLKLRESRAGEQFRAWFHKNCRSDTVTTAKEYASLLGEVPRIDSLPTRVMRFLVTSAAGLVPVYGTALGSVLGAADSFFVSKVLKGSSPKFFIEHLRQLGGKISQENAASR